MLEILVTSILSPILHGVADGGCTEPGKYLGEAICFNDSFQALDVIRVEGRVDLVSVFDQIQKSQTGVNGVELAGVQLYFGYLERCFSVC